jgi:hypothetical protein
MERRSPAEGRGCRGRDDPAKLHSSGYEPVPAVFVGVLELLVSPPVCVELLVDCVELAGRRPWNPYALPLG